MSIEKRDNGSTFLYKGEMVVLLKALSRMPIEKITIEEPDLEEVFMHYYEGHSEDGDD